MGYRSTRSRAGITMFVDEAHRQSSEYKEFWARLGRGEYQAGEYKRIGKGGREVWIQGTYTPILDADGRPFKVVKYATDITAAEASGRRLRGQIAAIDKSLGRHRVPTGRHDHHGQRQLPEGHGLLVWTRSKAGITACSSRRAYRQSPEYKEFWAKLGRGEYQAGEYKTPRQGRAARVWIQGSYNPILDLNGRPFKVVKYATDVTEQVKLRQGLAVLARRSDREAPDVPGQLGAELTSVSQQMAANAEETAAQANVASAAAEQVSKNVTTVSTGTEEMGASIKEIAKNANEAAKVATSAVKVAEQDQRHRRQARRIERRDRQRHQGHHVASPSRRTCWP